MDTKKMTAEDVLQACTQMGIGVEGFSQNELLAKLDEAGYNPEGLVEQLMPFYMGICYNDNEVGREIVDKVNSSIRNDKKYDAKYLPETDNQRRVQWSQDRLWTIPCKLETAKQLLEANACRCPSADDTEYAHALAHPDEWVWTFARKRTEQRGQTRYLVSLHGTPKGFNASTEIAKYRAQAI